MGNFYTSLTVRGPRRDDVVKAVKGRTAAISPTVDGFTVIWDSECENQDQRIIEALGLHLSSSLACPALAILNHDDDILWYALYSPQGKLDEYDSAPGYFEGNDLPPAGGNAQLLEKTIAPGVTVQAIERVLRSSEYMVALDRHSELLEALGMPRFAAGVGYNYITRGEPPLGLAASDLTFTS